VSLFGVFTRLLSVSDCCCPYFDLCRVACEGNQFCIALRITCFSFGLFTRGSCLVVSVLVLHMIYVELHEKGTKSSWTLVRHRLLTFFEV